MDKALFYAALRKRDSGVFSTRLTQGQVTTLELLLDEGIKRRLPLRHLAYVLATPYHEVGPKLQPIAENLNYTSAASIKKTWPSRFKTLDSAKPFVRQPQKLANYVYGGRLGNDTANDGWLYRGRGYPQTTGEENYERSGKLVGIDLVKNPDRMLEPQIAAVTMIESMSRGLYTGKKLSDYLDGDKADYVGARAIINADVKKNGAKIARYAHGFEMALREAGYVPGEAVVPKPAPKPTTQAPKVPPVPAPVPQTNAQGDKLLVVASVQQLLRDKGYPEVGEPDNKFGPRTRNAILAFQADNGLPLTGQITDGLLAELIKAPKRENAASRENVTAKDLKEQGNTTVKSADWLQKIGAGILVSMGLGGLSDGVVNFDTIKKGIGDVRSLIETLGTLGPWVLGIGAGAIALYFGRKVIAEQVKAFREGRSV